MKEVKEKIYKSRNKDGAIKNDAKKPRMGLIPQLALLVVGKVMTYGAMKYADYNWMRGFNYSILTDAAMRHIIAFNCGEDNDLESGLPHLAHAACCLLMLLELTILRIPDRDDRWEGWKEGTGRSALYEAQEPYEPSEYIRDILSKEKDPVGKE